MPQQSKKTTAGQQHKSLYNPATLSCFMLHQPKPVSGTVGYCTVQATTNALHQHGPWTAHRQTISREAHSRNNFKLNCSKPHIIHIAGVACANTLQTRLQRAAQQNTFNNTPCVQMHLARCNGQVATLRNSRDKYFDGHDASIATLQQPPTSVTRRRVWPRLETLETAL